MSARVDYIIKSSLPFTPIFTAVTVRQRVNTDTNQLVLESVRHLVRIPALTVLLASWMTH
jgi:hypothetical protein